MKTDDSKRKNIKKILQVLLGIVWIAVIVLFIYFRDRLTVDGVVSLTPDSIVLEAVILWVLYALKSLSIFMHSGVLSAASGIMFPLYIAIPVSLIGVTIMTSIPYFIGKGLGEDGCRRYMEKYPKLRAIDAYKTESDFLFSFAIRIVGVIPSDPLSALCGAIGVRYPSYILGTVLGMLPETLAYTILGTSIDDVDSPLFVTALIIRIFFLAAGAVLNGILVKKTRKNSLKQ